MKTVKLEPEFGVLNCPSCGNEVGKERIVKSAKAHCPYCRTWFLIELPTVEKKLIYIDQSLMSDFCAANDDTQRGNLILRILGKLEQLKALQKVFLVVSDIHSAETAGIPREHAEQSARLWAFQNNLADGHIAGNWSDVFIAQQRRALVSPGAPECFPSDDIGLKDPHRWRVGMQVVLTNTWRSRLQQTVPSRSQRNDQILEIIQKQINALGANPTMQDAIAHIRLLWRQGFEGGIAAVKRCNELLRSSDLIRAIAHHGAAALPPIPDSALKGTVRQVIEGLDDDATLNEWQRQLDSGLYCAALRLRIAFDAEILLGGVKGKPDNSTTGKFNEKYGVSRQNDINHITAFVPYVDVLTTDDSMRKLCGREGTRQELEKFPCKLFSSTNYSNFERWLDDLL